MHVHAWHYVYIYIYIICVCNIINVTRMHFIINIEFCMHAYMAMQSTYNNFIIVIIRINITINMINIT